MFERLSLVDEYRRFIILGILIKIPTDMKGRMEGLRLGQILKKYEKITQSEIAKDTLEYDLTCLVKKGFLSRWEGDIIKPKTYEITNKGRTYYAKHKQQMFQITKGLEELAG